MQGCPPSERTSSCPITGGASPNSGRHHGEAPPSDAYLAAFNEQWGAAEEQAKRTLEEFSQQQSQAGYSPSLVDSQSRVQALELLRSCVTQTGAGVFELPGQCLRLVSVVCRTSSSTDESAPDVVDNELLKFFEIKMEEYPAREGSEDPCMPPSPKPRHTMAASSRTVMAVKEEITEDIES